MPSDMEQRWRKAMMHSSIDAAWLEKLKGLVAVVERKLGDGIAVSAYPSYAAFLRSPKDVVKERSLYAGDCFEASVRTWQLKMLISKPEQLCGQCQVPRIPACAESSRVLAASNCARCRLMPG